MNRSTALILACLALCPAAASAQSHVYQWTDANGVRHYSQTPPPRGTVDERTIKTAAGSAAPAAKAEEKSAEQRLCEQAKANLTTLESSTTVAVPGKNGDSAPQVLTDAQRGEAKTRALKESDLYCSKK